MNEKYNAARANVAKALKNLLHSIEAGEIEGIVYAAVDGDGNLHRGGLLKTADEVDVCLLLGSIETHRAVMVQILAKNEIEAMCAAHSQH